MKKFLAIYKPYLIQPILHKAIFKFVVALVLLLTWYCLFNENPAFLLVRDGFMVPALILLGLAWFSYLKLDGLDLHFMLEGRRKQPKKKIRFNKGMEDYVDTDVVSYSELSEEEQCACRFASSLLSGLVYLVASLGAMLFV